jgi:staphylococcal nuclease domain-containing protein 1
MIVESGYGFQAKEFIRTRCIGKVVKVSIDYDSSKSGENGQERAKTCATVFLNPDSQNSACLNVALVSKGLATVVRHKKEDKDKSSQYEQLIQAEVKATAEGKGVFSSKSNDSSTVPVIKFNDASEVSPLYCTFI